MNQARAVQESTFRTHDGIDLFYRRWPACGPRRGAIVLFHRGHEHSGRMAHLADELGLPDFDFYAWDARGHGRSPGKRGFSPSFGTSVRDVQTFIDHLSARYGLMTQDIGVVAQSVGAVTVATWVHDYAPPIRCLVLTSPAFKVKLYVPFARTGLRWLQALRGNFFVNSYVKSRFLTHDPERQRSYDNDQLITRPIAVNVLLGLYDAAERVIADAHAITVPTQLLISGADWVVHHPPQHTFFTRLGTSVKEKHVLAGFYHDTLGEIGRAEAVAHVRRFVAERFASTPVVMDLRDSDRVGPTHEEAAALARPLPWHTPRGLYWAMYRQSLKLAGILSVGIRIGQRTGFDSGSTLDYVYRNTPTGRGLLGHLIDRKYLSAIGWRGIRQRKQHLEELLRKAMFALQSAGLPVHILDIAAGHGRYVIETLQQERRQPQSVLLRDYNELNVRSGRQLIQQKGFATVARFEQGDAFDRDALARVEPRPTVGIVSGLYELFPENDAVGHSLAGLADAIEPGGYLLYTGQPWHPQLELIARVLTSHRQGWPWVMRRRTQAEMDQLVAAAGFEKLEQRIDEWGIFTVSLARRIAA